MPKERTYTDSGYLEVQWAKDGGLVCIASVETRGHASGCDNGSRCGEPSQCPPRESFHQFTRNADVRTYLAALRRASRQSF